MSYMFSFCINLNNVDLSSFDAKNVIDMTNMFFKCENLINLEGDERQLYVKVCSLHFQLPLSMFCLH